MCENCGYNSKLFWPLTLVFVGTVVLMLNFGVLPQSLWRLWPIALVIIGLIGISGSCEKCGPGKYFKTKKKKK